MTAPRLDLTRDQVLAYRRGVGALDERLPAGPSSLRHAAWAGLQDSMPRAALLSIHARVRATHPSLLDDPSLVQLWGPRFSAFVVAARDHPIFSLGRQPYPGPALDLANDLAGRIDAYLGGREQTYSAVGHALGVQPNQLRYAVTTGTVLIRWDGARQPTIRTVPTPDLDVDEARLELVRRFLHVFGPATDLDFANWAGIRTPRAVATFAALADRTAVRTPIGEGWILASDEPAFRAPAAAPAPARLLPSGDASYLFWGRQRELLVPDAARRGALWTTRVWPGAVLVGGEVVGTWRRANEKVTIESWRRLTSKEQAAVEAEATALPLPGLDRPISVGWDRAT